MSIIPINHIDILLNNKNTNLNIPKNPIFNTILASMTLISVFTSTCSSGSQVCRGHIGYFIPNIIIINIHI